LTLRKPQHLREQLFRQLSWEEVDPRYLRQLIDLAREEDLEGAGLRAAPPQACDVTTLGLPPGLTGGATLTARSALVVCGLPLVPLILEAYSAREEGPAPRFYPRLSDGDHARAGDSLGTVQGPARVLLQAERILLNFIQRLSGVATLTARYVEALEWSPTKLLDTRKTTPGFRVLEKYAVARGGGWNHRIGLFDRVMLKDNHLAAGGATAGERLAQAVRAARKRCPGLPVEVEIDAPEQLAPVLEAGADIILFDNFGPADLVQAVAAVDGRSFTEASGKVTLETLPALSKAGLDFISTGATVHQAPWADIGLDWTRPAGA